MNIDNLVASVASTSSRRSKYDAMLDDDTVALLDEFVTFLQQTKTVATSQSYRSYVAKALALGQSGDELTSDQRSAVRAMGRFMEQR